MSSPRLHGTVAAFDGHAGLGEIRETDGTVYPFHCTQIADGSRTIAVGTQVEFGLLAGRAGRWEAAVVAPDST